jgi:hypothetical protein
MIGAVLEFDDLRNDSLPSQQLDELARVYARAAARAYFAKLVQEGAVQKRESSSSFPAGERGCGG